MQQHRSKPAPQHLPSPIVQLLMASHQSGIEQQHLPLLAHQSISSLIRRTSSTQHGNSSTCHCQKQQLPMRCQPISMEIAICCRSHMEEAASPCKYDDDFDYCYFFLFSSYIIIVVFIVMFITSNSINFTITIIIFIISCYDY